MDSYSDKKETMPMGFSVRNRLMVSYVLFAVCPLLCFGFIMLSLTEQFISSNLLMEHSEAFRFLEKIRNITALVIGIVAILSMVFAYILIKVRTLYLEEQQSAVNDKNIQLEKIKNDLIEKTEKLESNSRYKSEFLANMSHELRTPLNSILLISRLLTENRTGNLGVREIEFAKTIQMAGWDLLSLIDDILDLSKIEAGRFEIVPDHARTSDLKDKIIMNFKDICMEKGIGLITEIKPDVPENVFIDLKRMAQVIKNLVSNAVKFTENGFIMMEISMPETLPGILAERFSPHDCLKICVKDTGPGIPEDKKEFVFQAFQQLDGTISRQYGGTGLGLSISRELVRLMGGEIILESTEGIGSTFLVYIPCFQTGPPVAKKTEWFDVDTQERANDVVKPSETQPRDKEIHAHNPVPGIFSKKKILIGDNDMRNVYSLISAIGDDNPDMLVGKTIKECLDILDHHPSVDLIVLDSKIKGMHGFKTIEKMQNRKIPIILVLTAEAASDVTDRHFECPFQCLTKPVDMNVLVSVMKDML